ncbi:hypothetical protein NL676_018372 [Syzygium grande]|nr:hypothetical protein NL676_018372 [Syzygium grande]
MLDAICLHEKGDQTCTIPLSINQTIRPLRGGRLGNVRWLPPWSCNYHNRGTEEGNDLTFLDSLSNCTNLRQVFVPLNHLKGVIPDSLGNFSTTLTTLWLDRNLLHGSIPSHIVNLVNLEILSLFENKLSGSIPQSIGELSNLQVLRLDHNILSGIIPSTIGNATSLNILLLSDNMLEGSIPDSIGNFTSLKELDLSRNNLAGALPDQVWGLTSLSKGLSLAGNALTGPIPSQVGEMVNLVELDVSDNSLSGEIPTTLGNCLVLQFLRLEGNHFNGVIPLSLKNLKGIEVLDLSRNNLSGQIPEFFLELPFIQNLNLSFNMFDGEVPRGTSGNLSAISVEGNNKLCGGFLELHLPPCRNPKNQRGFPPLKTILTVSIPLLALAFASVSVILLLMKVIDPSLNLEEEGNSDNNGQCVSTGNIRTCLAMILQVGVVCSAASPRERMDIGDVITELYKAKSILLETRLS